MIDPPLPKDDRTGPAAGRSRRKWACPMSRTFGATRKMATGPSPSFITAVRVLPTVWLHMGAFGPKRVVTADDTHSPAAPYRVIDNEFTLLDASDLVFIDAPGTGFRPYARGRQGKGILRHRPRCTRPLPISSWSFLSRHNRWNSPKLPVRRKLRHDALRRPWPIFLLQNEKSLDLNGRDSVCRRY